MTWGSRYIQLYQPAWIPSTHRDCYWNWEKHISLSSCHCITAGLWREGCGQNKQKTKKEAHVKYAKSYAVNTSNSNTTCAIIRLFPPLFCPFWLKGNGGAYLAQSRQTRMMMYKFYSIQITLGGKLTGTNLMMLLKVAQMQDEWTSSNGRPIPADTGDNSPALDPLSGHPIPWHLELSSPCCCRQMMHIWPEDVSRHVAQSDCSHQGWRLRPLSGNPISSWIIRLSIYLYWKYPRKDLYPVKTMLHELMLFMLYKNVNTMKINKQCHCSNNHSSNN